ncbi:MAG TPA: PEP-CTERM sorting domain-containing protein [Tepidisphaeraceae bacterium]|nr:PEP-CTERM sorting domain-containing protein [Tepidisphaeraceae bacterium]
MGLSRSAPAQMLYVGNSNQTVGVYTGIGQTVNSSLFSSVDKPTGIAISGSNIYVATWDVGSLPPPSGGTYDFGQISSYTTSGTLVNQYLISFTNTFPFGVVASGSHLFVSTYDDGKITEYSTSGTQIMPIATGLNHPAGLALSGSNLFVANSGAGTIGEYTTSGSIVNAALVSGLSNPVGVAVSGSNLFVTNGNAISEYTTSGALVNATYITGLNNPWGLAIYGSDLYVTNNGGTTIGKYSLSGGSNTASLVSGLPNGPTGIALIVPEPAGAALMSLVTMVGAIRRRRA